MNGALLTTWAGETILSVTILMAIVMLIRRPVGQIFGPQIAYLLWAIPAARMLMPVWTITVEAPPETVALTTDMSAPFVFTEEMLATVQQGPAYYEQPLFWFTLWLGGAALFMIYQLGSYIAQRDQLLADAVPMGEAGNIQMIEVAEINSPFAFGLIRKYIALPIGFDHRYTHAQRALILQHEIAHHRAGDLWVNAAALTVLSLHWFNPVAWLAWRQFRFDQEAACDARVISHQPVRQKQLYSAAIAKTATGQSLALASPLISKNKLKERIKIMSMKEKTGAQKNAGRLLVGTALVSALALTATVSYAVQSAPPEAPLAPLAAAELPALPAAAPAAPALRDAQHNGTNIQTVDIRGEIDDRSGKKVYVHKITNDGRTIFLRTDRKLTDEEIAAAIVQAEESRLEADEALKDAGKALKESRKHQIEIRKIQKEVEKEVETAMREAGLSAYEARTIASETRVEAMETARQALAEVERAMAEARQDIAEARVEAAQDRAEAAQHRAEAAQVRAKAQRELRSSTVRPPSPPAPPATPLRPISQSAISGSGTAANAIMTENKSNAQMKFAINVNGGKNISVNDCNTISFLPSARAGVMSETAYASVVKCSGLKPGANEQTLLKMTLNTLKQARKSYAKECDKSDASQRRIAEAFDREIAHLNRKIAHYG